MIKKNNIKFQDFSICYPKWRKGISKFYNKAKLK